MIEIDNEIFQKNLLLTQAYCELQLRNADNNPATALRTFNPIYNEHQLFSYKKNGFYTSPQWKIDPLWENQELYEELFEKQLAHKQVIVKSVDSNQKFNGRILVAEIDITIWDGASEAEAEGFIDINDCPPIDTWFYKALDNSQRIFFAWVPQSFIELTNRAIAVNCVDCLLWYEDWLLREKVTSIKYKQAGTKISFLKHINKLFGK